MALNLTLKYNTNQKAALAIALLFVLIGSTMCWNSFTRDSIQQLGGANSDAEAAAGYYIFTTWLIVALGAFATGLRTTNPILSDALAMATVSATFSHWTRQIGVQNIAPVYQPTSLYGLNGIQDLSDEDQLSGDTQEALHVLLAGGILSLFGMMIAAITPVWDYNLANTNSFLKQVCLALAIFAGFIGVIILWAHGDLSEIYRNGNLFAPIDSGALDLTAVVVALFILGAIGYLTSSRAVAAFGVIAGGPFALVGLSLGQAVAANANNSDDDAARAGGIFCWFSLMGLWGFSLLLYLDTHDPEPSTMDALTSAEPIGSSGGGTFPPMVDTSHKGQNAEPMPTTPTSTGPVQPVQPVQPAQPAQPAQPMDDVDVDALPSAKVGGGAAQPPSYQALEDDPAAATDTPTAAPGATGDDVSVPVDQPADGDDQAAQILMDALNDAPAQSNKV
eukprot:m.204116 g.204116  ORF g.204116 m.204116 type:complete len:448 (-) comp17084_c0_seq5:371-1714(-)